MSNLPVPVLVPARNAAHWRGECLESIGRRHPPGIIVIDGCPTENTAHIARSFGARVISDEGGGLPAARILGERNASQVRSWFGVCATLMRREGLLPVRLDDGFRSGEDPELRIRLEDAGYRPGVSDTTVVRHRVGDTFGCARDPWIQDGARFARTIRQHTDSAGWMVALPLQGSARGAGLSLRQAPRDWPYLAGFLPCNYGSRLGQILRPAHKPILMGGNAAGLTAARVTPMLTGFLFWALAALLLPPAKTGLGSAVIAAALAVAPAAAVARHYGLAGLSVLWSAAPSAVAVGAGRRLFMLTR